MKPVLLLAVAAALAATLSLTDVPATAGKADRAARPTAAMAAPRGFPGTPPLFVENGTLGYAGYIGGAGNDRAYGVAIDTWGMACVAGVTEGQGFPALGGPKWTYGGGVSDIFLTRVEWSGSSIETSGFVGASHRDEARGIAASTVSPDLYLAGFTDGLDSGFPGLYGPQLYSSGLSDAWVGRIQVPELIQFSLKKGALKDTAKPLGDSLKASGTFLPIALLPFDPQTMAVRLTFGGDDPKVVDIPAAAPGWKSGKGKHAFKGADVSLKLDFVKGTFAVALFKSDFPSLQENPIRVFVELGGALYGVSGDWTESGKAPGNFNLPYSWIERWGQGGACPKPRRCWSGG